MNKEQLIRELQDKGFNFPQAVNIINQSYGILKDEKKLSSITKDGEYFVNDNVNAIAFCSEEEALFFEFLLRYVQFNIKDNHASKEQSKKLLTIVNSLIGVDTEWKF